MKILVTGGAGFIGSNLCKHFINKGYVVVCLDNLSTGRVQNLSEIIDDSNFSFVEGDITNYQLVLDLTKDVTAVLHQAALGSVPRSINSPLDTNNSNITGFLTVLQAATQNKVDRFIYAASSSTYGDNYNLPKVEHIIGKPLSPYAVTKLVNELYADVFSKLFGIKTIGLRYFNVFGPNQDPNGAYAAVIPKFINLINEGKNPLIHGDGLQSRDFTYIDNVVYANELSLLTNNSEAFNQVYNVACGYSEKLIDITDYLIKKLNPNVSITFGENRLGDIKDSLADISKISILLGYEPKVHVFEGLDKTMEWFLHKTK
jgi:UDP-N-acetylglucosamine/UDP-N-acetylgalactosamine 4-epimerase